jgi:hypothetical protein
MHSDLGAQGDHAAEFGSRAIASQSLCFSKRRIDRSVDGIV